MTQVAQRICTSGDTDDVHIGDTGGTDDVHIGALGYPPLTAHPCPLQAGNAVGWGSLVFSAYRAMALGWSPGKKKDGNKVYNSNSSELIQDFLKLL